MKRRLLFIFREGKYCPEPKQTSFKIFSILDFITVSEHLFTLPARLKTTEAGPSLTPRWRCETHALPRPPLNRDDYSSPGIRGGSLSPGRGIWLAPKVMFTLQAIDSWSDPSPSMSQACGNLYGQHRLGVTRLGLPGHCHSRAL